MNDVIIIGAGPAGMSAAIYAARRGLKTLVLSGDIGGQITKTYEIENYPGLEKISGAELAKKMKEQAEKFGAIVQIEEVKKIQKVQNGTFSINTLRQSYTAKSIILTFGKKPREIGVPGEDELKGRGVTYCATCDAPFFRDKTVAVVGGGNSALDAALLVSKFANKVYLIHRGDSFRGEEYLVKQVTDEPKVETRFNTEIAKINGETAVESIELKDGKKLVVSGVMVEVGYVVDRSLVEGLLEIDDKNQIVVNNIQETTIPGIFAAGDLTPTPYKQIVISAGEGAKAALSCFAYLQKLTGQAGIVSDWH